MNKHYTPDISELLHYGQETECLSDKKWTKATVNEITDISVLRGYLNEGKIRIKHLDSDDVQELGYKYINSKQASQEYYEKGDITIWFINGNIMICKGEEENVLFFGKIKSKSELSRILKMVL